MTVVDASALVELLTPASALRAKIIATLPPSGIPWRSPDVVHFEVFSALRRRTLRGELTAAAGAHTLVQLRRLPIETASTAPLLQAAWLLRDRCSSADALYAVLAQRTDEPLLTTDAGLARAAAAVGVDVLSLHDG